MESGSGIQERLFGAQGGQRFDVCGAASGQSAGDQRNYGYSYYREQITSCVEGLDAVER